MIAGGARAILEGGVGVLKAVVHGVAGALAVAAGSSVWRASNIPTPVKLAAPVVGTVVLGKRMWEGAKEEYQEQLRDSVQANPTGEFMAPVNFKQHIGAFERLLRMDLRQSLRRARSKRLHVYQGTEYGFKNGSSRHPSVVVYSSANTKMLFEPWAPKAII